MRLADLQARGAFVSKEPTRRELTWFHVDPDTGEKIADSFSVWVVRPSYGDIETRVALAGAGARAAQSAAIAACIRLGENAEEQMTYEQAYQLDPSLALLFIKAINDAGVIPKKQGRSTKSGTSSSLPASAGGPSKKRKRR
jgi:hypothetical protein